MWYREHPLYYKGKERKERWLYKDRQGKPIHDFEISVTIGKETDLISLKKKLLDDIKRQVEYFRKTRTRLYMQGENEEVSSCPVCGYSASRSTEKIVIYGARYNQCDNCSHVYVINRPSKKLIDDFYLSDVNYASIYADKSLVEFRVKQIALPWVAWMCDVYEAIYHRRPRRVLDVGSGAGHFVYAAKKQGMDAKGIELSEHSRKFAKDFFDIELDGGDFVKDFGRYKGTDVVTFWGLLEHTPNPKQILQSAYKVIKDNKVSMVIAKVPRWYSISTAIQSILTNSIIRHLDPMGHIMCFTEASIATLFVRCNLIPKAAWYYGMDIYELLTQIGIKLENIGILTDSSDVVLKLQGFVDESFCSDSLTLAGVPIRR